MRRKATVTCARPLQRTTPQGPVSDPAVTDTLPMDMSPIAKKLEAEFAAVDGVKAQKGFVEAKPEPEPCAVTAAEPPAPSKEPPAENSQANNSVVKPAEKMDVDDAPTDVFFAEADVTRAQQMDARDSLKETREQADAGAEPEEDEGLLPKKRPAAKAKAGAKPKSKAKAKAGAKAKAKATAKAKGRPKSKAKAANKASALEDDGEDVDGNGMEAETRSQSPVPEAVLFDSDEEINRAPAKALPKAKAKGKAKAKAGAKAKGQKQGQKQKKDPQPQVKHPKRKKSNAKPGEMDEDAEDHPMEGGGKATFARRYKPGSDLLAARRWTAIKEAFELHVQPKVEQPSSLEAQGLCKHVQHFVWSLCPVQNPFWKHVMETATVKGKSAADLPNLKKTCVDCAHTFLTLERVQGRPVTALACHYQTQTMMDPIQAFLCQDS